PDACAGRAHVRRGAGIAVVAERHVRRGQAHAGAVAGGVHARVGAGARAPRCLEPAGRRATVPVQAVAVVALPAEVEGAVAAGPASASWNCSGTAPTVCVSLITPKPSAVNVFTP